MGLSVGYVRLSRDDDKRNYTSIENQKLIISQYAKEHGACIDRYYEDDGISGYVFDRPGFQSMMNELYERAKREPVTVYVKDFSRLGRHNAKVLLLLEEFEEKGIRLIAIDDIFDSASNADDDIIGIKTWYNERYVKDISRKIKKSLGAKQKEGTLLISAKYGYDIKDGEIVVNEDTAAVVRMIDDLYVGGMGYRQISQTLNARGIDTPSMTRYLQLGNNKNTVVYSWSDAMVREILSDDYYTGVYRTHKRERPTVHGRDKRVSPEAQYVFYNHHEAIRSKARYELIQDIRKKRNRRSKGTLGQWEKSKVTSIFTGNLYCKDCGYKLTPIERKTTKGIRKYYICSNYNSNGKRACASAHTINDSVLVKALTDYLRVCSITMERMLKEYDVTAMDAQNEALEKETKRLERAIHLKKDQLKLLIMQKIKDMAAHPDQDALFEGVYERSQEEITEEIKRLQLQLDNINLTGMDENTPQILKSSAEILNEIVEAKQLTRADVDLLVDRIVVDKKGNPEIILRYNLSEAIGYDYSKIIQNRQNEILAELMKGLAEEERGYTSVKSLHKRIGDTYGISMRHTKAYVNLLSVRNIISGTGDRLKPYKINKTKAELEKIHLGIMQNLHFDSESRRYAGDGIRVHP